MKWKSKLWRQRIKYGCKKKRENGNEKKWLTGSKKRRFNTFKVHWLIKFYFCNSEISAHEYDLRSLKVIIEMRCDAQHYRVSSRNFILSRLYASNVHTLRFHAIEKLCTLWRRNLENGESVHTRSNYVRKIYVRRWYKRIQMFNMDFRSDCITSTKRRFWLFEVNSNFDIIKTKTAIGLL